MDNLVQVFQANPLIYIAAPTLLVLVWFLRDLNGGGKPDYPPSVLKQQRLVSIETEKSNTYLDNLAFLHEHVNQESLLFTVAVRHHMGDHCWRELRNFLTLKHFMASNVV